MRYWVVGGGVIERDDDMLLVKNRRRNGSTDWTTPGGVIDEGETVLGGLSREVTEETGLSVGGWTRHLYTVTVVATDLDWTLRAEIHLAGPVTGEIHIDDPDGIVEEARWVGSAECVDLCRDNQQWLSEPLGTWLDARWDSGVKSFDYHLAGATRDNFVVTRT